MGIILQILGLIITFSFAMEALRRIGIDVGWLNPFSYFRRRAWRQKTSLLPVFDLRHPIDVVGALGLALLQTQGTVTSEQKQQMLQSFKNHMSMDDKAADDLWLASSHMLRNIQIKISDMADLLTPSRDKFTPYHQQTLIRVLRENISSKSSKDLQQQFILEVEKYFQKPN